MNPQNHDDLTNELGRAMHDQADGISGSPITLGDVKGTVTRIRRRRALTASAAVAAAVAIIVPTVIFGGNLLPKADDGNKVATNAPTPTTVHLGDPLEVEGLSLGDAPKIPWIENGRSLHSPDGNVIILDRAYSDVVRYDDGYLATYVDNKGVATGVLLDAGGNATGKTFATAYSLALSSDAQRILYVADGDLVVHDNASGETDTIKSGAGPQTEPIAVTDDTAYYNVQLADYSNDARWFRDGAEHDPRPNGIYRYTSVDDQGWATAINAIDDSTGNCTEVTDPSGSEAGSTCKLTLQKISSDGRHILAQAAHYDGYGSVQLTVTNRDGVGSEAAVVLEYLQTDPENATFMDAVWEDATHLLVITSEPIPASPDRTWQLIRLGLDGSAENAAEPVRGEESPRIAPFALAY